MSHLLQTLPAMPSWDASVKVAVLMGGTSAERDISLMSGTAVLDALKDYGVTTLDMPLTPEKIWRAIQDAKARQAAA